MKSSAIHRFREKLRASEPVYGLWIKLEAAAVTDIAAGLGLDWLVIDADSGHLDWAEILEHMRATNRSNTLALIRVAEGRPELIRRAIDLGADGILISKIETAAQLQSTVKWAQYATAEKRDGQPGNGDQSSARPAREPQESALIVPMIETAHAVCNIHDLLQVNGVDAFFFRPLSDSEEMQFTFGTETADVEISCTSILKEIRIQGKHAGIVAVSDEALMACRDLGFSILGVGFDSGIIRDGIRGALDVVRNTENHESALHGCREGRD